MTAPAMPTSMRRVAAAPLIGTLLGPAGFATTPSPISTPSLVAVRATQGESLGAGREPAPAPAV